MSGGVPSPEAPGGPTGDHATRPGPAGGRRGGGARTAVVAATEAGRRLAADLVAHLGAELVEGRPRAAIAAAWGRVDRLVLVMATGAATRLIAPHLDDKTADPGVVAVDDTGAFAVALTGGHERGANALAERLAGFLDATPVVTTAAERTGTGGLHTLGRRFGVRPDPDGDAAAVGGALVSGEPVHLCREIAWPLGPLPDHILEVDAPEPAPLLWVTDRLVEPPRPAVVLRPPSLVVGVGSSRGVTEEEVGELLDGALEEAGLSPRAVAHLATAAVKTDEAGILAAARSRDLEMVTLPVEALATTEVPNPSEVVREAVGTPSVAEAAALHQGGELLVEKTASAMATVAVARRPVRGRVALVSLGPGDPALLPPAARDELADAEVVLGYGPYVDQAAPHVCRGCRLERYALGEEVDRAERALALARGGRAVALVGSGDVGVYAMASPMLERTGDEVEVVVVPGITAMLAAAARLGAPLGHDHCVVSLSDLLTPWEVIRRRLEAAAAADLVVALYNPRSRRRDWQLEEARSVLLAHRSADTPVGVVRDAYRPGEEVTLTTLDALEVAAVQMTTLVIVGSSRTRVVAGRMVTPRGYGTDGGGRAAGAPDGARSAASTTPGGAP